MIALKKAIQESLEDGAKTNLRLSQETEQLRIQLLQTNTLFAKFQKAQEENQTTAQQKVHTSPSQKSTTFDEESDLLKKLRVQNESLDYRLETLRYDVDSLKDNMVRQRRNFGEYITRVSNIEGKLDQMSQRDTLGSRSTYSNSRQHNNFMSNNSMASNVSEVNRFNRFSGGQDYGQPLQALLDKDDDDEDLEGNFGAQQNQAIGSVQNYTSVQVTRNVQQVKISAMTPQGAGNFEQKSGRTKQQIGMDIDDPSFLKKFGSNMTGNPPEDEDFDPNLSLIKETDQSNLIEPNEFNNFYFEGRDSLRNSLKGNQGPKNAANIGPGPSERITAKPDASNSGNSSQHSSSLRIPEQKPLSEKVSLSDSLKNILSQNLQHFEDNSAHAYTTPKLANFYEPSDVKAQIPQPQSDITGVRNILLSPIVEEQNSIHSNQEVFNKGQEIMVKVPELRSENPDKQTQQLNSTNNMNTSFKIKSSVLNMSLQNINPNKSVALDQDNDDTVTLQVDDNGFLLDKEGYPILDDNGLPVKLTDENIEFFKENNLYVEEEVNL